MKDWNLQTPELHDFSDLKFRLPGKVLIGGLVLAGLALVRHAIKPAGLTAFSSRAADKPDPTPAS